MLNHLFITTCSFQKTNNYQALMTSLWRIWIYNMYKPKIIVWLEAWLNHNSISENLSDGNFFHGTVTFIPLYKSKCTLKSAIWKSIISLLQKLGGGGRSNKIQISWILFKVVDIFLTVLEENWNNLHDSGKNQHDMELMLT